MLLGRKQRRKKLKTDAKDDDRQHCKEKEEDKAVKNKGKKNESKSA